uniref:Uncharacterized protein n=1 Tax=Arundo donax TaxID=35708 RepID=A0A0A8YA68_ARUDO
MVGSQCHEGLAAEKLFPQLDYSLQPLNREHSV